MLILLDVRFWFAVVVVALAVAAVTFSLSSVRGVIRKRRAASTWLMHDELEE